MTLKSPLFLAIIFLSISSFAHAEPSGRFVDVRVLPIGFLLNEKMADVGFAILPFLSLGVIGYSADIDLSGTTAKGNGFGGRATVHFSGNRFSSSWILSAYYYRVGEMTLTQTGIWDSTIYSATLKNIAEHGAVLGKMWFWNNGFNTTFALGARKINLPTHLYLTSGDPDNTTEFTDPSIDKYNLRLEFAVGWAF